MKKSPVSPSFTAISDTPLEDKQPVTKRLTVSLENIQEPALPSWAVKKVISGLMHVYAYDFMTIRLSMSVANGFKGDGHNVLNGLMNVYWKQVDNKDMFYKSSEKDLLQGFPGLKAIAWFEENWQTIPKEYQDVMKGLTLYGWPDTVRDDMGQLSVPYIVFNDSPKMAWIGLSLIKVS